MNGIGLCEHSLGYDRDQKLDGHTHNDESCERHLQVSRSGFTFLAAVARGLALGLCFGSALDTSLTRVRLGTIIELGGEDTITSSS